MGIVMTTEAGLYGGMAGVEAMGLVAAHAAEGLFLGGGAHRLPGVGGSQRREPLSAAHTVLAARKALHLFTVALPAGGFIRAIPPHALRGRPTPRFMPVCRTSTASPSTPRQP